MRLRRAGSRTDNPPMSEKTVTLKLNQQQLELLDRTIAQGVAQGLPQDRVALVRLQAEKLLMGGGLAPTQEEALQMQLEEVARLSRIIEELLFLSRAEARAITLALEPQDPVRFLQVFAQDALVLADARALLHDLRAIEREEEAARRRLRAWKGWQLAASVLLNLENRIGVSGMVAPVSSAWRR